MWVFALVCLIACWWIGDLERTTKAIFTLLFLASFALLFVPNQGYLFVVAQCVLVIVIGGATFGLDWLMRRHW